MFALLPPPPTPRREVLQLLVGTWEWNFILCTTFCKDDCINGERDKGLAVTFQADSTLVLTKNDIMLQMARFQLTKLDEVAYQLTTMPNIEQLDNRLSFCENKIGFRPIEGAD